MRTVFFLFVGVMGACAPSSERAAADSAPEGGARVVLPPVSTYARYVRGCPPVLPAPPVARAVFDVHVRWRGLDTTSVRTSDVVEAIERRGGRVIHSFHIAVVRAELDTATARTLVSGAEQVADKVEQVRDTTKRDLDVQISFDRPLTPLDSERVARVGGAPQRVPRRDILYATLADSVLPAVLAMDGVQRIRPRLVLCGTLG